ncbi:mitochondrial transcription termination factor family protein [Seminavis robusta]|uniref:Mitochondrial transcription termination factor family protein n=1 Tax=Seminavis robusta TaxID=568900 RepID=A0A9N8DWS7_9STRA|nr:mitochondrial transcription termination factor family protein [Seminavis robusta]|eukprot:Sro435_g142300.1 mitochondrial transcription termination factor family protein (317) ;mRNA; f:24743-25693
MTHGEIDNVWTKQPWLMSLSTVSATERASWLQHTLQIKKKGLRKIIMRYPQLLGLRIENLDEKWAWFGSTFNTTDDQLARAITVYPTLLGCKIDSHQQKIDWLQARLDINSTQEAQKLFLRAPAILYLSQDAIDSRIQWIQDRTELTGKAVTKVLMKHPPILYSSIEGKLDPTFTWISDKLGHEAARKMVTRIPSVLCMSLLEKTEPQIEYLKTKFHLDGEGISKMLSQTPQLVAASRDNIENTFQFYADRYGHDQTIRNVIGCPTLLMYSLEKRLIPRWDQAVELGFEQDAAISYLALYTNKKWDLYVESKVAGS